MMYPPHSQPVRKEVSAVVAPHETGLAGHLDQDLRFFVRPLQPNAVEP